MTTHLSRGTSVWTIFITVLIVWLSFPVSNSYGKSSQSGGEFKVSTVADNVDIAVSIAFAPDWRLFYLEKNTGNVRVITDGKLDPVPWATIEVDPEGERGLLDIAFDPYFKTNGYIYFYHSVKNSRNNRVVRLKESGIRGKEMVTVLEIPDHISATNHNGGGIAFEPPNHSGFGKTYLYVSVGDGGGRPGRSQEDTNLLGKVLKINVRGLLPITYNSPAQLFYAKGLRNSFGITWNKENNTLYGTENGPIGRDEINRLTEGSNYGWPIEVGFDKDNIHSQPLWDFGLLSVAPTGITFYPTSGNFPKKYKGNMFVTDYNKGRVYRIKLSGKNLDRIKEKDFEIWLKDEIKEAAPEITFADIAVGPDGAIYLAGFTKIIKIEYSKGEKFKQPAPKFN